MPHQKRDSCNLPFSTSGRDGEPDVPRSEGEETVPVEGGAGGWSGHLDQCRRVHPHPQGAAKDMEALSRQGLHRHQSLPHLKVWGGVSQLIMLHIDCTLVNLSCPVTDNYFEPKLKCVLNQNKV